MTVMVNNDLAPKPELNPNAGGFIIQIGDEIVYRSFHPTPGAGAGRQLCDPDRRLAGDDDRSTCGNIRAAISRRSPSPPFTSARTPSSSADLSRRRSSARSPPPTGSITSNRKANRASRLITARLKLNYDANKALSDISSKVDADPARSAAGSGNSGHQH